MKKTIFLLLSVFSIGLANAQTDSSKITQTITLSQLHHTYLVGFMGNIDGADKVNYLYQLRAAYDSTNMAKTIQVTASSALIVDLFYKMSLQPEGWTSEYNNQIKAALLPQITNPWLGGRLAKVVADNDAVRNAKIQDAKQFILSLNQ
jgi:hypothetical protein